MLAFQTRDADSAAAYLAKTYGADARVEECTKAADFELRLRAVRLGMSSLVRADFSNWRVIRTTGNTVVVSLALRGAYYFQTGRHPAVLGPTREASVARPFETTAVSVPRGAGIGLFLPVDGLIPRVERLLGRAFGKGLLSSMVDDLNMQAPVAKLLAGAMRNASAESAELSAIGLGPLVSNAHEEILGNLASACLFPHLFGEADGGGADCGPVTIRRARDYIRENAGSHIELSMLAQRLGVSMRSLQGNFRRYYGVSPRDYLVTCRLERARQRLLDCEPTDTVTLIALESGFGDMGHFSAKYRERYGELPSQTLYISRQALR